MSSTYRDGLSNRDVGRPFVSHRQADWLAELASNFYEAIELLPPREQEAYREGQRKVADTRRNAQTSDRLLRLRVK